MSLMQRFERGVLRDEAGDGKDGGGGGDDDEALQPGPGETTDSVAGLRGKKPEDDDKGDSVDDKTDDKSDDKTDDKTASSDDKTDDKAGDDDGKKEPSIPKSRLDAALARARAAEAELRKTQRENAQGGDKADTKADTKADDDDDTLTITQAQKRVEDLDVEIAKAMKDEEDDGTKLAVLMREQRELQEGIRDAKAEDQAVSTQKMTADEIQFDRVVTALEEQIPVYDPNHADYDEDIVNETLNLAHALNGAGGRTAADSMLLAVDYMSGKLGLKKEDVADIKKETDKGKNADTASKLPPDLPDAKGTSSDKAGLSSDSANVAGMSQEEFALLANDDAKLKKLRGDFL